MILAYGHVVPGKGFPIGKDGGLPWWIPSDSDHYLRYVADKTVVGKRRSLSGPGLIKLRSPQILLITSQNKATLDIPREVVGRLAVVHSLDEAFEMAEHDIAICGGSSLYEAGAKNPRVTKIIASEIDGDFPESDTFVSEGFLDGWKEIDRSKPILNSKDPYSFDIVTYVRE